MAMTDFDFVLFGGGGDLAMRKLIPALYALSRGKGFPASARIIAVGRHEWRREQYLDEITRQAKPNIEPERLDEAAWTAFCDRINYVSLDASDAAGERVRLSTKHTLALTNRGGASTEELLTLAREVRDGVRERFGVTLVNEPVTVGCEL